MEFVSQIFFFNYGAFYYLESECDHLPEAGNIYIGIHPTIPPEAANVAKLIRRRRISSKRDKHPQNPSIKNMAPRVTKNLR